MLYYSSGFYSMLTKNTKKKVEFSHLSYLESLLNSGDTIPSDTAQEHHCTPPPPSAVTPSVKKQSPSSSSATSLSSAAAGNIRHVKEDKSPM